MVRDSSLQFGLHAKLLALDLGRCRQRATTSRLHLLNCSATTSRPTTRSTRKCSACGYPVPPNRIGRICGVCDNIFCHPCHARGAPCDCDLEHFCHPTDRYDRFPSSSDTACQTPSSSAVLASSVTRSAKTRADKVLRFNCEKESVQTGRSCRGWRTSVRRARTWCWRIMRCRAGSATACGRT